MTGATTCTAKDYYYLAATSIYVKLFTTSTRCFVNITLAKTIMNPLFVNNTWSTALTNTYTFASGTTIGNLYAVVPGNALNLPVVSSLTATVAPTVQTLPVISVGTTFLTMEVPEFNGSTPSWVAESNVTAKMYLASNSAAYCNFSWVPVNATWVYNATGPANGYFNSTCNSATAVGNVTYSTATLAQLVLFDTLVI